MAPTIPTGQTRSSLCCAHHPPAKKAVNNLVSCCWTYQRCGQQRRVSTSHGQDHSETRQVESNPLNADLADIGTLPIEDRRRDLIKVVGKSDPAEIANVAAKMLKEKGRLGIEGYGRGVLQTILALCTLKYILTDEDAENDDDSFDVFPYFSDKDLFERQYGHPRFKSSFLIQRSPEEFNTLLRDENGQYVFPEVCEVQPDASVVDVYDSLEEMTSRKTFFALRGDELRDAEIGIRGIACLRKKLLSEGMDVSFVPSFKTLPLSGYLWGKTVHDLYVKIRPVRSRESSEGVETPS